MKKKVLLGIITKQDHDEEGDWEMIIEGRPSTEDVDSFNEITEASAFMEAMPKFMADNPVMMFNHNPQATIGRVLEFWEDKVGPIIRGGIARTDKGREVAELIRAGIVKKMSFMFSNPTYEWDEEANANRLLKFGLLEMGPVSIPANMGADLLSAKALGLGDNDLIKEALEHGIELKHLMNSPNDKAGQARRKGIAMSTDVMKQVEATVGDMKSQVDDLASDFSGITKAQDEQARLVKTWQEKHIAFEKGAMTKDEFETFATNIEVDIKGLNDRIQKATLARKVQGGRQDVDILGWKARSSEIPVVLNDMGHPLPEVEQKAWHYFQSPIKLEGEFGAKLKMARELNDTVVFCDSHLRETTKGNYNITHLKTYKLFYELMGEIDPVFQKAMASTTAGTGDEWVPTEQSAEIYEAYNLASLVEGYIPHWAMPSNPATWPIRTTRPRMYRTTEAATNNPNEMTKSQSGTGLNTFTAETYGIAVGVSPEFIEDSIVAVVPQLRSDMGFAMGDGYESVILNSDNTTAGTHMDTAADWATDTAYPESYEKGMRKFAIAASQTLDCQSGSLGDATSALAADDLRYLRQLLPDKLGHRAKDLVYVVSLKVWLKMLSFAQYSQPGTYGANASWLTGDMPSFDGSPLIVTANISETMASTGLKTGSNDTYGAILFNKTAFKIGERRGILVEFEKNILTQQWSFVATARKSFQAMGSAGSEGCSYGINIPA